MRKVFYYIRQYPLSLLIIGIVIYLSFFHPPQLDDVPLFPHFDKVAHFCMYGGMSGMLWLEFLLTHRRGKYPYRHGFVGGTICPILFSGMIEILQGAMTTYRSGDWFDFLANTLGVLTATAIAWFLIRSWIQKRAQEKTVR